MTDQDTKSDPLSTYFDSNIRYLQFTGFWVYDNETKTWKQHLQHIYNYFCVIYVFFLYMPAEIAYLSCSFGDLDLFLRTVRDIGNHSFCGYKAFNYFLRRKELVELMDVLRNGDYEYEEQEGFNPKLIIEKEKRQASTWTTYFLHFCNAIVSTMFVTTMFNFIFRSKSFYEIENDLKVYKQEQPVHTVSPFGTGTRPKFVTTHFYTMIACCYLAWMIVALDSLFITLMSCISAHLKILQGAFNTLRTRCIIRLKMDPESLKNVLLDPLELQKEVNKEMIRCVKHLQTVFRVSEKLEDIYTTQTLVQTVISLGEICFCLYILSENLNESLGSELPYLMATGFEFLMYCWFGNGITEASIQVSYALYDSDWFSTNLSFRKLIIYTMTRMQRPIYVTIGKITPLTFSTFLTIARGAYTFFTFLKQRHGLRRY